MLARRRTVSVLPRIHFATVRGAPRVGAAACSSTIGPSTAKTRPLRLRRQPQLLRLAWGSPPPPTRVDGDAPPLHQSQQSAPARRPGMGAVLHRRDSRPGSPTRANSLLAGEDLSLGERLYGHLLEAGLAGLTTGQLCGQSAPPTHSTQSADPAPRRGRIGQTDRVWLAVVEDTAGGVLMRATSCHIVASCHMTGRNLLSHMNVACHSGSVATGKCGSTGEILISRATPATPRFDEGGEDEAS